MSPGSTGEALDPVALAHSLQRLEALSADLKMLTGTLRQTPTSASAPRPVLTPLNPPREI
jgi:hypothetical protein